MLELIERSQRKRSWLGGCAGFFVVATITSFVKEGGEPRGPLTFFLTPLWLWAGPQGMTIIFYICAMACLVRYFIGPKVDPNGPPRW
ncbi:hypothetical protein [Ramlibacter rhizophilus]|uniref:Uncharacterized protein n=1 Tax=Ramlibacter rhizophilus TaxID=1781167 RepID=A0A4Z0BSR5_9BURK|nr:hypothetical protein [Ramlibacter rhizophilus]TFZ01470.1 hypothetical protein EZ242_08850 [Ramlibacter rhizophilus]